MMQELVKQEQEEEKRKIKRKRKRKWKICRVVIWLPVFVAC
jgi:hypothetical protein